MDSIQGGLPKYDGDPCVEGRNFRGPGVLETLGGMPRSISKKAGNKDSPKKVNLAQAYEMSPMEHVHYA
jgi:hypothetical protein